MPGATAHERQVNELVERYSLEEIRKVLDKIGFEEGLCTVKDI